MTHETESARMRGLVALAIEEEFIDTVRDTVVNDEVGALGLRVKDVVAIAKWLAPVHAALIEPTRADAHGRPSNERDGACICDYNPSTTDGPHEECPFHGRPYAYWIARGDDLAERVETLREQVADLVELVGAQRSGVTAAEPGCTCGGFAACSQCQERDAAAASPAACAACDGSCGTCPYVAGAGQ